MSDQLSVNTNVVIEEAARLESAGYQGNAAQFVEQLLLRAFSAGYRPLEPPVPARGPGAKRASVEAALAACDVAVRTARERRITGITNEMGTT